LAKKSYSNGVSASAVANSAGEHGRENPLLPVRLPRMRSRYANLNAELLLRSMRLPPHRCARPGRPCAYVVVSKPLPSPIKGISMHDNITDIYTYLRAHAAELGSRILETTRPFRARRTGRARAYAPAQGVPRPGSRDFPRYRGRSLPPEAGREGIGLLAFPTLYFYETGYSLHTLRQASRRSWRIDQRFRCGLSSSRMREPCRRSVFGSSCSIFTAESVIVGGIVCRETSMLKEPFLDTEF